MNDGRFLRDCRKILVFVGRPLWRFLSDARTTAWATLILAGFGLYLAIYAIHESRDIALAIEEQRLVSLLAARGPNPASDAKASLEKKAALDNKPVLNNEALQSEVLQEDWFESYNTAHWALRVHRLLQDDPLTNMLMHHRLSRGPDREMEGLMVLSEFYRKEARNHFEQQIESHLKEIVNTKDKSLAASQLVRLMVVGYQLREFKAWNDGSQFYLNLVRDVPQRAKLKEIFQRIEDSQP